LPGYIEPRSVCFENGARIPRLDTIVKLLGSLEAEADELLEGMAWRPGPHVEAGAFVVAGGGEPLVSPPETRKLQGGRNAAQGTSA
jgi:hypothetical protein